MNAIRRELLNGLLVLVVASLLSVVFSAFQVSFNPQLWVLILIGIAIAVTGYIVFELAIRSMAASEEREKEWLNRVGTPARLVMNVKGEPLLLTSLSDGIKSLEAGADYTVIYYSGPEGSAENVLFSSEGYPKFFATVLEGVRLGRVREYKRIFCYDHEVLARDHELKTGILRVGEGPGTVSRQMGEHCRIMMQTKGCSLYVAPVVLRNIVGFFGTNKVSMTVETTSAETGGRAAAGIIFFSDPPNGEIVEQFRQLERATERRMVAVHKIVFPEDGASPEEAAAR
jgi:hypothetical protein